MDWFNPSSGKMPYGDDFRVGPKSAWTRWDNTVLSLLFVFIPQVRCLLHTLNLCPIKPLENCEKMQKVIEKVAKAVNSVHKSGTISGAVEEVFGKSLRRRCATRWNTNFKMAESAAQFPWETDGAVFKDKYRLSRGEVALLKEFVDIMRPFKNMFLSLRNAEYPTICRCIPALFYLRRDLQVWLRFFHQ